MGIHEGDEHSELGVLVDSRLDGHLLHGEIEIAGATFLEQGVPELRTDGPIALERIYIGNGDAALEVAGDVLHVLWRLAVDVAWQIEVELVLLDLSEGDHARVFRDVEPLVEDVHDLVDVHAAQAVLRAVLHEAAARVDHEDALAGLSVLLVDDHDARGNAGTVEEIGGQTDDALDVALSHQGAADVGLGVTAEQHTVRQNARALAGTLERADDVQQVGVVALSCGWRAEGLEAIEGVVQRIEAGAPALVGKGRICDNVVEGFERVAVLELWICERVALYDERCRVVVQDHVHPREAASGSVFFLPVKRDCGGGLVADLQEERA